jgi:hypothetical protein
MRDDSRKWALMFLAIGAGTATGFVLQVSSQAQCTSHFLRQLAARFPAKSHLIYKIDIHSKIEDLPRISLHWLFLHVTYHKDMKEINEN